MKTEEKLGSVKRFGARYGRKPKLKFSKIEAEQRKLHKCPYCSKTAVKRVAVGIWHCRKCNAKFTGKAYAIRSITPKGEPSETIEEQEAIVNEEVQEEEQVSEEA
ncbi:50S ribosomal protein L37ae [Candidatus Woesearchaeota archaeon]|nr:50S ribosomal protein L37ae [Candidatus Woesearchaeota archaeon]